MYRRCEEGSRTIGVDYPRGWGCDKDVVDLGGGGVETRGERPFEESFEDSESQVKSRIYAEDFIQKGVVRWGNKT